jgi:hypothetical protein
VRSHVLNAAFDEPQKSGRFINRPERWFRASESLWSVVHKWAFLNHLSWAEIRELVAPIASRAKSGSQSPWAWGEHEVLLLASHLNLLTREFEFSTLDKFLFPPRQYRNWRAWYAEELRFCPECIRTGFHSALHQLLYLTKCPWHGVHLLDRCVHGNSVDSRFGCQQLVKPYSCVDGVPLWDGLHDPEWPCVAASARDAVPEQLSAWVQNISAQQPSRNIFAVRLNRRDGVAKESIADNFADSCDWRSFEPEIVNFLTRLVEGPEWLGSSRGGYSTGEITSAALTIDRVELNRIEAPRWPFRIPEIDSVPYEWEAYRSEVPTTDRYWTDLRYRCLRTRRSVVDSFAGILERHRGSCPAQWSATGVVPGGVCHLQYAVTNCRILFGVDQRRLGGDDSDSREDWRCLRPAIARTLDAQLERLLVWLGVPWQVLQVASTECARLVAWLVDQATAALVRNVLERLLFDSVNAQCKFSESRSGVTRGGAVPRVPLMEQDSFVGFTPDRWASPFAVTANPSQGEVNFHAYFGIPLRRWTQLADDSELCRETGMSPVTPAIVRDVLRRLDIQDARHGHHEHGALS